MSTTALGEALAEAATWRERRQGVVALIDGPAAAARRERWQRIVGSELPPGEVRTLGDATWPLAEPRPPWAVAVEGLHAELRDAPPTGGPPPSAPPFGDVVWPVVAVASSAVPRLHEGVSEEAVQGLQRPLLQAVVLASTQVLTLELALRNRGGRSVWDELAGTGLAGPQLYDDFVAEVRADGYSDLLANYPVLGRLWAQLVDDWRNSTAELLNRIESDRAGLAERLGVIELGALLRVGSARADRHDRGRLVWVLHFEHGSVVYKPRDLRAEQEWNGLISWAGANRAPVRLRSLWVWPRSGYGWEEYASWAPSASEGGVCEYFRRSGALMCLLHLVGGGDAHRENVIAAGDDPVLVDAEALMVSVAHVRPEASAVQVARHRLATSVLRTGLLPHPARVLEEQVVDVAGLDSHGSARPTATGQVMAPDARHGMATAIRTLRLNDAPNVVRLPDGSPVVAETHVGDVVEGYRNMYAWASHHREELLAQGGCLEAFRNVEVRVIPRPTAAYARLLDRTLTPGCLRSGVDRDIALEALRSEASPFDLPAEWLEPERDALWRLDIPRFVVAASSAPTLWGDDGSGWEAARRRVRAMDQADLETQVELIRLAFAARPSGVPPDETRRRSAHATTPTTVEDTMPLQHGWPLSAAAAIADRVLQLRIDAGIDGTVAWIVPQVVTPGGGFGISPTGTALYNGVAGIGLFLAAAAVVLDDRRCREAAMATARSLPDPDSTPTADIGGMMGRGSVVWALTVMGTLLKEPRLIVDAASWGRGITDEAIDADRGFDLAGGSAGAILALLRLHDTTGDSWPVRSAERCAAHLLAHRTGHPAAWQGAGPVPLAGLAHGAAGVAHALLRLHARVGGAELVDAAVEAMTYERGLFVPEQSNWRDLRVDVPPGAFMNAWCNGATGIGLARAQWTGLGTAIAEDHAAALVAAGQPDGALDHLCCGSLSRVELLLTSGLLTNHQAMLRAAEHRAAQVHRRAMARGGYGLTLNAATNVQHASFFRGISGIGYELLRLSSPELLPNVLLLD